jgi:hypothetical protein
LQLYHCGGTIHYLITIFAERNIMKALHLLLPGLLLTSSALAQTPGKPASTDVPDVTVMQVNWKPEIFIPALYDDPMRINQERDDLVRDQKETAKLNVDRARQGQTPIPQPAKKIANNTPVGSTPMGTPIGDEPAGNQHLPARPDPGASFTRYRYEAKIRNSGPKTIRVVVWEYITTDSSTQVELGRRQFVSRVTVRSGKTATLSAVSRTPPTRIVQSAKSDNKDPTHTERVVINRLEYNDGSFWEAASN